jgi:putative Holliday junction resolvase
VNTTERPGRVLGVDPGSRRIGLALSDPTGLLASPLSVVQRTKRSRPALEEVARIAREHQVVRIVIGLPIGLNGFEGPAAQAARRDAELLSTLVEVPVEFHDERFTTVTAQRLGRERGQRVDRATEIDKMAAAVLLQSWLDGAANRSTPTIQTDGEHR